MAENTAISLRNQLIYSVYVRNHTEEGTFAALERDLERIKELGTDIIWLMPIHPIGVKGKKGSLGCPYAIADYRGINPAYGTMDDFVHLVDEIHKKGMKCMIDVVYNHTSQDSVLVKEHPEFFYRKPNGAFGNRCGEWEDVYDLDYDVKELWEYQIETLKMWAEIVDGFRCDVASCVPTAFWVKARAAVETVKKNCIWLAESVHSGMVLYCREVGIPIASDNELYEAFDLEYQYDIISYFDRYLEGTGTLVEYLRALNLQESMYPQNYIKLRYLENHDTPRIAGRVTDRQALLNWFAFLYFQKGTVLLYGGEEVGNTHTPSLFEVDRVDWNTGIDDSAYLKKLMQIKKEILTEDGMFESFVAAEDGDVALAEYRKNGKKLQYGIFSLKGKNVEVSVTLADGTYQNLIDDSEVVVSAGKVQVTGQPVILQLQ